jgi:transcription factor SFP1
MIAHSQPIALPAAQHMNVDSQGSYTGSSGGTFNPASFTRHFLGSPISWRAGSFGMHGNRFPAGSPTAQLLSSMDKTPESDSIVNALNVFEREGELVSRFLCAGFIV